MKLHKLLLTGLPSGLLCLACTATPPVAVAPEPLTSAAENPESGLSAQAFMSGAVTLKLSETAPTRPTLVTMTAKTPSSTKRVVFFQDDHEIATVRTAPYEIRVPFTRTERTAHQYSFRVYSRGGRVRSSAAVPLYVNIGRVLYVSPSGREGNGGLSEADALPTLQAAVSLSAPGDTVLAMDGTYTQSQYPSGAVANIRTSGTPDAWIALMNYPGQHPKVKSANWQGVKLDGAAYWIIQGLSIEGNRDHVTLAQALAAGNDGDNPATSGEGVSVSMRYKEPGDTSAPIHSHHIVIRGNTIYKNCGGGIGSGQADHLTIEDNVIWGNAWYSPYANSGVSLYQNWNSDQSTETKMIVRRNVVYDNRNLVPFLFSDPDPAKRVITDGNGVIIDDSRNTQFGSQAGPYRGRTLVENNVVYSNGARGIHAFSSEHVDIINNTTYHNSFQKETPGGEITAYDSGDVRVLNNLAVPLQGRRAIDFYLLKGADPAAMSFENNLTSGGLPLDIPASRNLIGADPRLTDPASGDFRPAQGSPAIDAGNGGLYAQDDIGHVARPLGRGIDIGAYEVR